MFIQASAAPRCVGWALIDIGTGTAPMGFARFDASAADTTQTVFQERHYQQRQIPGALPMSDADNDDRQSPEDREAIEVSNLVGGTIGDFLAEVEGNPNVNQAPLPVGPALIELAAAAIAHFVLNGRGEFTPKELISHAGARCMRMLLDAVDESDKARRAHLRLVK
jgi:hypothetical protein